MSAAASVLADIESQATREFLPILGKEKAAYVEWLVREHRPCTAVDVGSLIGYSVILIARNLKDGCRVTGIESAADVAQRAQANVALAGLERRARVVQGDATDLFAALQGPIDFVLLDAGRARYLHLLKRIEPKLASGAIVVANGVIRHAHALSGYLAYVRKGGAYRSALHAFGDDGMEVSVYNG